jgi:hypothetical protein
MNNSEKYEKYMKYKIKYTNLKINKQYGGQSPGIEFKNIVNKTTITTNIPHKYIDALKKIYNKNLNEYTWDEYDGSHLIIQISKLVYLLIVKNETIGVLKIINKENWKLFNETTINTPRTTPSVTTPSVTTPSVTTPSVTTPSVIDINQFFENILPSKKDYIKAMAKEEKMICSHCEFADDIDKWFKIKTNYKLLPDNIIKLHVTNDRMVSSRGSNTTITEEISMTMSASNDIKEATDREKIFYFIKNKLENYKEAIYENIIPKWYTVNQRNHNIFNELKKRLLFQLTKNNDLINNVYDKSVETIIQDMTKLYGDNINITDYFKNKLTPLKDDAKSKNSHAQLITLLNKLEKNYIIENEQSNITYTYNYKIQNLNLLLMYPFKSNKNNSNSDSEAIFTININDMIN